MQQCETPKSKNQTPNKLQAPNSTSNAQSDLGLQPLRDNDENNSHDDFLAARVIAAIVSSAVGRGVLTAPRRAEDSPPYQRLPKRKLFGNCYGHGCVRAAGQVDGYADQ
jgi:hypothetical protein